MAKKVRRVGSARPERFPWALLAALLASAYLFWVLPRQLGSRPVRVEFVPTEGPR